MSWPASPFGLRKHEQLSDDMDRISNLPEPILSHILSFLPTKDAVATSALSKRWKFRWRNIHSLFLTDYPTSGDDQMLGHRKIVEKDRKIMFADFVFKVLLFLDRKSMDKFSLKLVDKSKVYKVTSWIDTAVAKKVRVLEFIFDPDYMHSLSMGSLPVQFPCTLFSCKTLEVLLLRKVEISGVPSLVCLPNIRTLRLELVECDESVCNLISGCSSLETLYVERDFGDDALTFRISSPTLRNLTYDFWHFHERGPFEDCNYKLEIDAPSLRYLNLRDDYSRNFSVGSLCLLDEAQVNTYFIAEPYNDEVIEYDEYYLEQVKLDYGEYSEALVKLLQALYHVKHLSLGGDILKAISRAGVPPSFLRLTRLAVDGAYCGWNSLLEFIEGSDKLEYLTFSKSGMYLSCLNTPEKVPICLASCLQEMRIDRLRGREDELEMVAYILKNAKVLRKMTVEVACTVDSKATCQLLQKVSEFPRGSKECKITFS